MEHIEVCLRTERSDKMSMIVILERLMGIVPAILKEEQ
jgi:hypothetical protein